MSIHTFGRDNTFVIQPSGDMSKPSLLELDAMLQTALEEGMQNIIFDFTDLTYISSDGLRIILDAIKKLPSKDYPVAIVGMKPAVRSLFEVGGFMELINEFPDIEDAFSSFH
ncbi:MAG: anti-sigma factor antagonist [Pseudomonadota bacterium]|jgi:anti-anti-sigma factor